VPVGRIDALGQDGSDGNDGHLHPIPLTQNFPCDRTDASGHLFVDVFEQKIVASAAFGEHGPGCVANQPPARVLRGNPRLRRVATCPPRDLRNIAYGVLGPDAVSITYTIAGRRRTVPTGPDGAYIIVLPATARTCTVRRPLGGRGCLLSSGETTAGQLESGVITAVRYRDGHVRLLPVPNAARDPGSLVPERRSHGTSRSTTAPSSLADFASPSAEDRRPDAIGVLPPLVRF
jgi:hypothetical protein